MEVTQGTRLEGASGNSLRLRVGHENFTNVLSTPDRLEF